MKIVLQVVAWISLAIGAFFAIGTLLPELSNPGPAFGYVLLFSLLYLGAGATGWAVLAGIAAILTQLDDLKGDLITIKRISRESEQAPYLPGWDAERR